MMQRLLSRMEGLDDDTRTGIALLFKGIELIVRIAAVVIHIRIFINAWKGGDAQKSRIRRLFLFGFLAGLFSVTGKLFKDLRRRPENLEVPPWAKEFYNSLDIKRSR